MEVFARTYTANDASRIVEEGRVYVKRTVTHILGPLDHPANVLTDEGMVTIDVGGYIATDGKSVWPMSAEYLELNYALLEEPI